MQDINDKMGQLNIVFWNCASEILNKLDNIENIKPTNELFLLVNQTLNYFCFKSCQGMFAKSKKYHLIIALGLKKNKCHNHYRITGLNQSWRICHRYIEYIAFVWIYILVHLVQFSSIIYLCSNYSTWCTFKFEAMNGDNIKNYIRYKAL